MKRALTGAISLCLICSEALAVERQNATHGLRSAALSAGSVAGERRLLESTIESYRAALRDDSVEQVLGALPTGFLRLERASDISGALMSVGVLSHLPITNTRGANLSGVLVSPCHVLTAAHGVLGQGALYFSLGRGWASEFQYLNMPAEVIARGQSLAEREIEMPEAQRMTVLSQDDWALLRIAPIADIPPATMSLVGVTDVTLLLAAGFPVEEVSANRRQPYRFTYGKFARGQNIGTFGLTRLSIRGADGLSGGGVFRISAAPDGSSALKLVGIYTHGADKEAVSLAVNVQTIIRSLEREHPAEAAELATAQKLGRCLP